MDYNKIIATYRDEPSFKEAQDRILNKLQGGKNEQITCGNMQDRESGTRPEDGQARDSNS